MMRRSSALFAAFCLAGALTAGAANAQAPAYTMTTVAEGLDHPWGIAFLPDGTVLVTERAGQLRTIRNGLLDPQPVAGVPEVLAMSQGGLFEAIPHPDFAQNGLLYLSYAAGTAEANSTRLARARFDGRALSDLQVLFEVTPAKARGAHFGGRMAWMPDGTLMLTLGDGFAYREEAQRLTSELGTIVRLNADGSIPADNPFVGRADARAAIWSYGHRNVQGIALDPVSGRLYAHEHGPRGGDEVNLIRKGLNYGWPLITTGIDYTGAKISPYTALPGLEQPMVHWEPSIAPAGLAIVRNSRFTAWEGDLLIATLVDQNIRRIDLDEAGNVVGQETHFAEIGERLRDVRIGPDGAIWIATDAENGRIVKIEPR